MAQNTPQTNWIVWSWFGSFKYSLIHLADYVCFMYFNVVFLLILLRTPFLSTYFPNPLFRTPDTILIITFHVLYLFLSAYYFTINQASTQKAIKLIWTKRIKHKTHKTTVGAFFIWGFCIQRGGDSGFWMQFQQRSGVSWL